jgi:hypothetical protein
MRIIKKILPVLVFVLILFGLVVVPVMAETQIVPKECIGTQMNNECTLTSVENTITTVAKFIIGITGSVLLLVLIYGGVLYITSAGNDSRVQKATEVLKYAVIGLVIIIVAGMVIQILLGVLSGQ